MKNFVFSFVTFFMLCFGFACTSDERQGQNSVKGTWTVTDIVTSYGTFGPNVYNSSDQVNESGELGTFHFMDDMVDYSFMRNDTLFEGTENWSLTAERVNAGFVRVTEFTLDAGTLGNFKVLFDDGTSNSEKNASEMELTENAVEASSVVVFMNLSKDD